ncbi:tetratricopeptide repeat protein [Geodermatophilus sp. SYSU D00965]
MRVAVCIAGQMRGFEQAAPALLEHVIRPLGADVFVHTWSDLGMSNNIHNRLLPHPMRSYLKKQGELASFRADFPTTYERLFARSAVVTEQRIRDAYGDCTVVVEDYPEDEAAFFGVQVPERLLAAQPKSRWSLPLFYKVQRCNELKSQREREEGFTYDLVIRIRPDLLIGSDPTEGRRDTPGTVFHRIRTINPAYQVADQLFFGDSASMDAVTSLFGRLPEIYAGVPDPLPREEVGPYWAEGLLHTHVTRNTDVTPEAFRTEAYNVRSEYQLLDADAEPVAFPAFFDAVQEDLRAGAGNPRLDRPRLGCARALFTHGRPLREEADLAEVRRMVEAAEEQELFDTSLTRGLLAYKAKDHAGAEGHFRTALAAEPGTSLPLLWLGRTLEEQGRSAEALPYLQDAVDAPFEYASQNPAQKKNALYWRGRALESLGRWAEASDDYATVRDLGPQSFDLDRRLGRCLVHAGRYFRAVPLLQAARAVKPDNAELKYLMATSYVRVGVAKPVVSDIWPSGAPKADRPWAPAARLVYAEAHLALGRRADARAALEDFLARGGGDAAQAALAVELAERVDPEFGASLRGRLFPEPAAETPAPEVRSPRAQLGRLRRAARRSLRV